jgi:hypothetical protein
MSNPASAGRSYVTIVNGTPCTVWVAVYKRSPLHASEPAVAWQVVSSPPRGKTAISIPQAYQVCARYSFEPENAKRPVYQTNTLPVPRAPAGVAVAVEGISTSDRRTWGAVLTRTAENLGCYQIRIVNRFAIGVWSHVRQDERDIFPPRILPPMATWTEDLSSTFYLAVLQLPSAVGDLLPESEIARTEIAVEVGEHVKIQGGPRKGFEIIKISEEEARLVEEPEIVLKRQAPRSPEKKLTKPSGSKEGIRKRATVKKPAKKPGQETARRRDRLETKRTPAKLPSPDL